MSLITKHSALTSVHSSNFSVSNSQTYWVIDIGTTNHTVCSTDNLDSVTFVPDILVKVPNGNRVSVSDIGTVNFSA